MRRPVRGPGPARSRGFFWLALAALGASGCGSADNEGDWVTVKRDALILGVEVEGTLEAVDSAIMGPPSVPDVWSFKLAMLIDEGKEVAEGELLLSLDKSDLQRKLLDKQNERDTAQKELEKKEQSVRMAARDQALALSEAKANLHKAELKTDSPSQLVALLDVKKAKLDAEVARERVTYLEEKARHVARRDQAEISAMRDKARRATQRVEELEAYIELLDVKATRAGTVVYLADRRGDKKKVGDDVWWAEKVLEVVSLDQMRAKGMVAEIYASKVAVGQPVRLRLDSLPDVDFTGQVKALADVVQRKSEDLPVQVVRMDISLDETDSQRMRPGMRFRGTVETGRIEDALLVPIDAVFIGDDGPVAYRATDDGYETVPLEIGARNQTAIQVLSGLREGDRVSRIDRGQRARGGS